MRGRMISVPRLHASGRSWSCAFFRLMAVGCCEPTLLGYPVYTCDAMTLSTTVDGFPILFGNWRRGYLLADRTGMQIAVDQVTNSGYTRFYCRRRVGGCNLNNDALKALRNAD